MASWSYLQSTSGTSASGTTVVTSAFTSNLTSGSTLIAFVSGAGIGSSGTTSVKDSSSNAFIKIGSANLNGLVGDGEVSLWALNTPSGDAGTKPTVTATAGASSTGYSIVVQEVSGIITATTAAQFIEGSIGFLTGGTGGTFGPPTYTDAIAGEYLVYFYGDGGSTTTATVSAGYTQDPNSVNTSGNADVVVAYKSSTGGTEGGTFTFPSGSPNWALVMAAFRIKAASSYTVTATCTGASGIGIQVEVIDGVTESGGASATLANNQQGSAPFCTTTLTPNHSGSLVVWATECASAAVTTTALTNTNFLTVTAGTPHGDNTADSTDGVSFYDSYYTGTVTGGTGISIGVTGAANDVYELAGYELPLTQASWVENAATPPFVFTAAATGQSSASFTPAAGSVLVLLVTNNFSGTGSASNLSVSSSPALTWTQRAVPAGSSLDGLAAVYTATIPASAGQAAVPVSIGHAQFSPSHIRRYHHKPFGPVPRQLAASIPVSTAQQYTETLIAQLALFAATQNQVGKLITSVLVLTGAIQRALNRTINATLALTSSVTRAIQGRVISATAVIYGTTHNQVSKTLIAVLLLYGSLSNRTGKVLAGTVAVTGAITRALSRGISAPVVLSAQVTRGISRFLSATAGVTAAEKVSVGRTLAAPLVLTVAIATAKVKLLTLAAQAALYSATQNRISKNISAPVAVTASTVRNITRSFAAPVAVFASVSMVKVKLLTLATQVALTSVIKNSAGKVLSSQAALTASTAVKISKNIAAQVVVTGTVLRNIARTFSIPVALNSSVSMIKVHLVTLAGNISAVISVTRKVLPIIVAQATIGAGTTRLISRTIQGTIALAGQTARQVNRVLSAVTAVKVAISANKAYIITVATFMSVSGTVKRQVNSVQAAVTVLSAAITRKISTSIKANMAIAAGLSVGRLYFKLLTAAVATGAQMSTKLITSAFLVVFKTGVTTVNWVIGGIKRGWKIP